MSGPQVTARGPDWQELTRTGHWRELVGWVQRFDAEGRLLAPAQVADRVGNDVTVRVRVRVRADRPRPESPHGPAPQPRAAPPRAVRHGGSGNWELVLLIALPVLVLAGVVWLLWRATVSTVAWVFGNGEMLLGLTVVFAAVVTGIWLVHRK